MKIIDYGCLTTKRMPTRRGIIWLGQTCNFRCYFCYFANRIASKDHPEHAFFSLDKAKEICKSFVDNFNLNSIDIQGGEPTIYPHIFDLIKYCNSIGLKPTLITNGMALHNYNFCKKFKDSGIYDFLFSLQGIGETCDQVVGVKGAFKKQIQALSNIRNLGIPLRINAVLSNEILEQIDQVTDLAIEYNARVINFIGYNNTGDQEKLRKKYQVPYYLHLQSKLEPAIKKLEDNNIEVNLRFLPFCVVGQDFRKNIINHKQQVYDIHESEKISRFWIDRSNQRQANLKTEKPKIRTSFLKYKLKASKKNHSLDWVFNYLKTPFFKKSFKDEYPYLRNMSKYFKYYTPTTLLQTQKKSFTEKFLLEIAEQHTKLKTAKCQVCFCKNICDGFHSDFIEYFGDTAITPIQSDNPPTLNPLYYNCYQKKFIEQKEWDWYFND